MRALEEDKVCMNLCKSESLYSAAILLTIILLNGKNVVFSTLKTLGLLYFLAIVMWRTIYISEHTSDA